MLALFIPYFFAFGNGSLSPGRKEDTEAFVKGTRVMALPHFPCFENYLAKLLRKRLALKAV